MKPKFRFAGREGAEYRWEPVNAAARRIRSISPTTPVSWFWGDGTKGVDVTDRAHARGKEVGLFYPYEYAGYVRGLRAQPNPFEVVDE